MTETTTTRATLADGAWRRLHPATPLLKGGIALVVVLGIIVSNLRERVIGLFAGDPDFGGSDPITEIYNHGLVGWALLALAGFILIIIVAFYFSWRMHTFRVGEESVEVRSGILFRTHRQARLDRIQGINIVRPLVARIFGAAKLEVNVAGQGANVQLAYLGSAAADELRRDVLRLASGVQRALAAEPASGAVAGPGLVEPIPPTDSSPHFDKLNEPGPAPEPLEGPAPVAQESIIETRLSEFLAPELDPDAAPPESVVKIPTGRLIGSLLLSGFTIFLLLMIAFIIVGVSLGHYAVLFALVPGLIGSISFYTSRFTKSLRYTIAGTKDGVRVGFGLLSTSNDTIPPGRIHAVEVRQPLLWRRFGWWEVRINRAGTSSAQGAAGQANTTTLPVGTEADVQRVLGLLIPAFTGEEAKELIQLGMVSAGGDGLFVDAPRRARWLRPFSWRRTGYLISADVALLRRGVVWRQLVIVPLARMQSVSMRQGPILRALDLAAAEVHTVAGPVNASLAVIDRVRALSLFADVAREAVTQAANDTSEHWGRSVSHEEVAADELHPESEERP